MARSHVHCNGDGGKNSRSLLEGQEEGMEGYSRGIGSLIGSLLDGLGNSHEVIRHSLWWGGHKGCQYSAESCVLSDYLMRCGVKKPVVTRKEAEGMVDGASDKAYLSPMQYEFLHIFDHGGFPELLYPRKMDDRKAFHESRASW